ncbi:uncharacterized protein [Palaemon carinicauda]|uniref:uncharacterized protein n=1 Tax=Palaemon carinicauda TaxID=392227 RepID=UPI0035B68C19
MVSIIKSERGNDMVVDEQQFMYHKHGTNKDGTIIYWVCSQRKKRNCKARLHTKKTSDNDFEVLQHVNEHTHSSTKDRVDAKVAHESLKEKVKTSHQSSRVLVAQATASLDESVLSQMPNTSHISRNIRKWRQKLSNFPSVPCGRAGYSIPLEFTVIEGGKTFLQYDSGIDDVDRILMFASDAGLQDLKRFKNWTIDGTFKVAPEFYYQLLTVHVQQDKLSIPRVFALLPNKTEVTYRRVFEKLSEFLGGEETENITIDFEKACFNGIKAAFPDVFLNGCFFHFSQSLYRKIVELGFKQEYHNNNEFSLKMRHFSALAFVPTQDVIWVFEELSDDDAIPQEFLAYFESTYIGIERGTRNNRRRVTGTFPLCFWNVYSRVVNSLPRTNNNVEAFHNSLNKSVGNAHPNIWRLIDALKDEERLATI